MLQKIIYLLTILSTLNITAQSDNLFTHKFIYNLTYQSNYMDVKSKKNKEMLLLRNKNSSVFLSKHNFTRDSLLYKNKINNIKTDWSKIPNRNFFYKIFKNTIKDSITVYDKIFVDNYKYRETKKNIKWKITSETSIINGFKCQKATTTFSGRYYDAWFSNEIAISDGPYKFSGLPGLIIKIADSKNHYVFELIKQSKINYHYQNLKPTRKLFLTEKDIFFKKQKDFKDNIVKNMSLSGFTLDKKHEKKVKERQKKKNNPIELGNVWYLE